MNRNTSSQGFFAKLLNRTGGWYIVAAIAIAQVISLPGTILGIVVVQSTVNLPIESFRTAAVLAIVLLIVTNIILLLITYYLTRSAFSRLQNWKNNQTLTSGTPEEGSAWFEITHLPWRYTAYAFICSMGLIAVPILIYSAVSINMSRDQLIHTFFGSLVAALCVVVISSFVIERIFVPAREVLLPRSFEAQIAGTTGLKIFIKFQLAVMALIIITILMIAPIGYSSVITAITTQGNVNDLVSKIQALSIIGSVLALIIGVLVSYLMASSISSSVNDLVKVFTKVEEGKLFSRAKVISTDEVGELAVFFNRMVTRLEQLQQNLEGEVAIRTAQIEASNEIGRITSSILDPDVLANRIVNLVTDRFGHYHTALFLVDENNVWAMLIDGTGEAGKILKERQFKIPVSGKGMVSAAIASRQPQVMNNIDSTTQGRMDNPLLPETCSEIALPLMVGDQVLGILDVQSKKENAFNEKEINTLQNMANQVAIAIENARLFNSTQRLLEEMRSINQQYITQSWNAFGQGTEKLEFQTRMPAPPSNELFGVNIPLTLRDQILGQITIEGESEWTPEQHNLLEAVATQAAFALENARLLSESQQTALRERIAAGITEKIWSSPSIDGILQTAVRELGRALEVNEAIIELKTEE